MAACDQPNLRSASDFTAEDFERMRGQAVVGVEENQEPPCRFLEASLAGIKYTGIGLANIANPRPVGGRDLGGVVGRTVVDNDHFKVVPLLTHRRIDRPPEEATVIECRNHDRKQSAHDSASCRPALETLAGGQVRRIARFMEPPQ